MTSYPKGGGGGGGATRYEHFQELSGVQVSTFTPITGFLLGKTDGTGFVEDSHQRPPLSATYPEWPPVPSDSGGPTPYPQKIELLLTGQLSAGPFGKVWHASDMC